MINYTVRFALIIAFAPYTRDDPIRAVELSSDTLRFGVYHLFKLFELWVAVLKKAQYIDAQAWSIDINWLER